MLTKIISGGQTGADRGALDAAIKLGIPHGGWIPKGRKTEAGPLPEEYQLTEMKTVSYAARTERNVIDSDGTLILSHGRLKGGSALTLRLAAKHGRPCLHMDLSMTPKFQAALKINHWLTENDIRVLNVAGPRASHDAAIYEDSLQIIESVYFLNLASDKGLDLPTEPSNEQAPQNVQQAVDYLAEKLSLQERTRIANMAETELGTLRVPLGEYITNHFGLWYGNPRLMASCRFLSKNPHLSPDMAVDFILRRLWLKLRDTHKIRVIK